MQYFIVLLSIQTTLPAVRFQHLKSCYFISFFLKLIYKNLYKIAIIKATKFYRRRNDMKKVIQHFLNLKLRSKLFLSYLLFISLVIIASIMIYSLCEKNLIKQIEESSTNIVQQLSNNIANKMSNFDTNIMYATGASNIFEETDFSNYISLKNDVKVLNVYLESSGASVCEDLFMNLNGQCFYYSNISSNEYMDSDIYKYVISHRGEIYNEYGKSLYATFDNEPGIIYIIRADIRFDTHLVDGIVAIGIRDEYFRHLFPKSLLNGSIVVCDKNSNVLIGDESVKQIVADFNAKELENISGQNYFNYKGEKMIIESGVSEDNRWKVLYVISLEKLLKSIQDIKRIVTTLCVTLLVFSVAIAVVISGTLTANIRLLLKKIKSVENGDFTYKVEPKSRDETADLFNHFNIMSDKLNDLINRIAYEKIETKRAEYNALLAQINPHFIFNALESINGLAKIKGETEIVEILSSLSYLMRITLSSKKSMVKLKDEISYIDNYISIHKIITGGRINVEYDLEDEALDCLVPKLIMQPIVENAINYGLEDKNVDALIVISVHTEGDTLKINISDNGKGIESDKLERILESINGQEPDDNETHAHIGLRSVNRRLKILYGEEYGLNMQSTPDVGTVVELSLPTKYVENLLR